MLSSVSIVDFEQVNANWVMRDNLLTQNCKFVTKRYLLKEIQISSQFLQCVKSVQIWSFSGPYFPVFSPNTGKYGPEETPYLDTFYAVLVKAKIVAQRKFQK